MSIIRHPINPHMTRKGNNLASFVELVSAVGPQVKRSEFKRIHVTAGGTTCPLVSLAPGGEVYLLGEIGLQYLVYRVGGDLDYPRKLYRKGDWKELADILNHMLKSAWADRRIDPDRTVITTSIDSELVGVLLNYASMTNQLIASQIDLSKMKSHVKHWIWRPLESTIYLDFALIFEKFHYGAAIRNGETGHRTMSFSSILWTEDELRTPGADPIPSIKQSWETEIPDYAYRRHTSADRVIRFTNAIKSSLKESEEVISLKRSTTMPGKIVVEAVFEKWSEIKGRDSAKMKMEEAMKDLFKVAIGGSALDVIEATIQASDILGTKAADNIAEQAIGIILAKVSDL